MSNARMSPKHLGSLLLGIVTALAGMITTAAPAHAAAAPYPPYIAPTAGWLTTVNYYRAMAGLPSVSENPTFSAGAAAHSCYMLYNGISHDEIPGKPGYTVAGDEAGNSGNVAVSSVFGTSERTHVELWMTGPFHAVGVLRPGLTTAGFGKCDLQNTPTWHSGATLDVIRGITSVPRPTTPILWPGNGTTTSLTRFVTESPNPMTYCGWTGSAGLPLLALMPEAAVGATATMSGPSGPLQVCVLSAENTDGVAKAILQGDNAVVVMPRAPLDPGTYQVTLSTQARTVPWSFTVDPAAATGVMPPAAPAPVAAPTNPPSGVTLMAPVRVVDTRIGEGTTRLQAGGVRVIQIAGGAEIPADATTVVANVTATEPDAPGYVKLWNCSANAPEVSTLNYQAGEIVPNSAVLPLGPGGTLCVFALSNVHLVLDVTGYYTTGSSTKYVPLTPSRVMDTRVPLGPSWRLQPSQTVELQIAGQAGVPSDAAGVALNVTTTNAAIKGYVTVYPCASERPLSSNLNPAPGKTRANLAVTALSPTGSVCIFTLGATDLVVDVVGYLSHSEGSEFTPSTPFRFTDTRDIYRTEVNAGTNGAPLAGYSVLQVRLAGTRGIPADAKAVSANLTVVGGVGPGYLSAWPCGPAPTVSNLNYDGPSPVANAARLALSPSGDVCLLVMTTAHVIIDVNGWWS